MEGDSCDDGDPNTSNDVIQSDGCTCAGTAGPANVDCNDILVTNDATSITINNIPSGFSELQLIDPNYDKIFYCYQDCNETEIINNLSAGEYELKIKYWDNDFNMVCDISLDILITGGPCTDDDGDGVCVDDDCDDNDANFPMDEGTACDDGDANTENDEIQSDGCTCEGTPIGCTDVDGDGICADDDCDDNDANFPMAEGTACDDGDANTENDEIQSDGCTCEGTLIPTPINCDNIVVSNDATSITINGLPIDKSEIRLLDPNYSTIYYCYQDCMASTTVSDLTSGVHRLRIKVWDADNDLACDLDLDIVIDGPPCVDVDGDGVCEDDDCDDNDPNLPTAAGTSCDDGDADTENDEIQSDGCSCEGTPIGCTDVDGDGICADDDCDDNDANFPMAEGTACDDGDANTENDEIQSDGCTCAGTLIPTPINCDDIVVSNDATSITINGLPIDKSEIRLLDPNYSTIYYCYQDCMASTTVSDLASGVHRLRIKVWDADNDLACDLDLDIVIDGPPCVDVDGDGVCADDDCDDNDANFPTAAGTSCDDGDADTENDEIQSDGCTCEGTPIGCTDIDGDGICADDDCDDNDANFPMAEGTACDDGDANTENDEIQSDGCTCAGTLITLDPDCDDVVITNDATSITITGLNAPIVQVAIWDDENNKFLHCLGDCNITELIENLPEGTYNILIKFFDDDYDLICDIRESLDLSGGPCTDVDGDGVCADDDCDDNDVNFPMTPGTTCDDGDATTDNDVIQSDGCTCAGGNISSNGDCDDVTLMTENDAIIVSGLDATPIALLEVFNDDWDKIYKCYADCDAEVTLSNLPEGTYFIIVRLYDDNGSRICEIEEYVTIDLSITQTNPHININVSNDAKPTLIKAPAIHVYPNPTAEDVYVRLDWLAKKEGLLVIYNNQGKVMMQKEIMDENHLQLYLPLIDYAPGLYWVNYHQSGRKMISEKLIIARK